MRSHGTSAVSMLVGNGVAGDGGLGTRGIVPEAKVLFYAVGAPEETFKEGEGDVCEGYNAVTGAFESDSQRDLKDPAEWPITNPTALAVRQAVEDGADVISISIVESIFATDWELAQIHALRAGVPIVAGSTNPTAMGTVEYLLPYSMNGVVAVGGVDKDGNVIRGYNLYGTEIVDARGSSNLAVTGPAMEMLVPSSDESWGPTLGSGTSLATPLVAGTIALGLEKYPKASAFQVIQTMIRTTGSDGLSGLKWNGPTFGYGIVNATAMLAVDPTQYPDENPLFVMTKDDPRCGTTATTFSECAWGFMSPPPEAVWPDEEPNAPGVPSSVVVLLLTVGALSLVSVAVIVPIAIARSRKRRASQVAADAPDPQV